MRDEIDTEPAPYLADHPGLLWEHQGGDRYRNHELGNRTWDELLARRGPVTELWLHATPVAPEPQPIDPDDIRVGTRVRRVWHRDGVTLSIEGVVSAFDPELIFLSGHEYLADVGAWFLIQDAPDADAELIAELARTTDPGVIRTLLAADREARP